MIAGTKAATGKVRRHVQRLPDSEGGGLVASGTQSHKNVGAGWF